MSIPIGRQRVGKHIPATHEHATMGRVLLYNGAVNMLRQQYRLFSLRSVQNGDKKCSAGKDLDLDRNSSSCIFLH
jgi:hypothetical protein